MKFLTFFLEKKNDQKKKMRTVDIILCVLGILCCAGNVFVIIKEWPYSGININRTFEAERDKHCNVTVRMTPLQFGVFEQVFRESFNSPQSTVGKVYSELLKFPDLYVSTPLFEQYASDLSGNIVSLVHRAVIQGHLASFQDPRKWYLNSVKK